MNWSRAIVVWLLIVIAESIHGTIRQLFIAPAMGDMPARQLGVFIGSLLILLVSWLTARWLSAVTLNIQLEVGALWVILTLVFEISLGLSLGYPGERMISDYNPFRGGLMGFGLMFMLLAPLLGAKLRSLSHPSANPSLRGEGPNEERP